MLQKEATSQSSFLSLAVKPVSFELLPLPTESGGRGVMSSLESDSESWTCSVSQTRSHARCSERTYSKGDKDVANAPLGAASDIRTVRSEEELPERKRSKPKPQPSQRPQDEHLQDEPLQQKPSEQSAAEDKDKDIKLGGHKRDRYHLREHKPLPKPIRHRFVRAPKKKKKKKKLQIQKEPEPQPPPTAQYLSPNLQAALRDNQVTHHTPIQPQHLLLVNLNKACRLNHKPSSRALRQRKTNSVPRTDFKDQKSNTASQAAPQPDLPQTPFITTCHSFQSQVCVFDSVLSRIIPCIR